MARIIGWRSQNAGVTTPCMYSVKNTSNYQEQINMVSTNCSDKDVIYPLTEKEIAQAQIHDKSLEKLQKYDKHTNQLIEDTELLCKDGRMAISKSLQHQAVSWYHHYLQHPGHTCLKETLHASMYWKGMQNNIQSHIKNCQTCQGNRHTSKSMENSLYVTCKSMRNSLSPTSLHLN